MHLITDAKGTALLVEVADFASPGAALAMRSAAARRLPGAAGLVFAKVLSSFGSRRQHGFAGLADPRRQLVLTGWRTSADAADHLRGDASRELMAGARHHWYVLSEVLRTRGEHGGAQPLAPVTHARAHDGPIAVLTLGRASVRTLGRFAYHGTRLSPSTHSARGLITAQSAGWPLTGNMTLSLWEAEGDMLAFAHAGGAHHHAVARARPAILSAQLNARLRPLRIGGRWDPRTTHQAERLAALARELSDTAPLAVSPRCEHLEPC